MSMALLSPRRLRTAWQRVCPIPLPRYCPGTPRVDGGQSKDMFEPPDPLTVAPTLLTLAAAAASPEAASFPAQGPAALLRPDHHRRRQVPARLRLRLRERPATAEGGWNHPYGRP